jgi:radical SAM protein with 4Fe4S-binding SPASM domain
LADFESGTVHSLNASAAKIVESMWSRPIGAPERRRSALLRHTTQWSGGGNERAKSLVDRVCALLRDLGMEDPLRTDVLVCPLRNQVGRLKAESQAPLPLEFMWLELTSRCDLKCVHCYADAARHARGGLSGQSWSRILEEGAQLGCRRVQFVGGEPLLCASLPQLCQTARESGYESIEVFTSGVLLSERLLGALGDRVCFAVSLYSHRADTHDAVTGVAGSHARTMEGLRMLQKRQLPLRVALIAMRENQDDIEATRDWLKREGFRADWWDVIRPTGRGGDRSHVPTKRSIVGSLRRTRPVFRAEASLFSRAREQNTCWAGKIAVLSDGRAVPCVFARARVVGSLPDQSLAAIVQGSETQSLWRLTADAVEDCGVCEYRYLCRDCRPLASSLAGGLFAPFANCTYDPRSGIWGEDRMESDTR